ncbi:UDP-4-amino-4,6-dideoxy-N-acetyl-beta-L-altrosamine transaminase [Butyrivibrio proteoclasticus]|uniref:UDP-4-amino-4,6-dideoxy-N-acetyl-beta-L-altrosamine transaminase n=1 Tax=Butyrivibrio proteoclasticus TaxID=43305 RepID=A0A1I5PNN3_9FIRM|nr:UDP-4-amino-4,6-dideoxy-N-acetyl-beta-L-altrosamine transaminase [Butyrivibrio proteoclasticus]SFP35673.1 UDP-4-amino-4,6-dideoxy-N-acetyl-beta-L-altrosamine transaminase [Butyrivibrio proteoclasticus]
MEKLAIDGGTPVRKEKIFYGRQWVDAKDVEAVSKVLTGDYLTCGPTVTALEQKICEVTDAKYAVSVCNGTAALHCACIAAGLGKGDEVITTPITFAASANCAVYVGATPVFADINPETYNIDPDSIEAHITDKTKAIVAVDFTGQAVEHKRIREICDKHGLIFIEDAAHAIGTKYDGKPVGSLADMTCFSFHPVKTVTAGEGGAITTNDPELYRKLHLASQHGIVRNPAEMVEKPEGPWVYEMQELGFNYRMTDFQAALLISQLNKLDKFSARRREIVNKYNEAFKDIPELFIQKEIPESDTTRHLYIIQLKLDKLTCTRRQFFDALAAENVQPQVHYIPVYYFPFYEKRGYKKGLCPVAEEMYKGIMSIPLYPMMTDEDVTDVIAAVKKVVNAYKK